MKISVGSQNPSKIEAVQDLIQDYKELQQAEVISVSTDSGVADQPLSLDETIQGAMNRAQNCFNESKYGIGLEAGLITVKYSGRERHMNVCAAIIYDGKDFYLGLSSLFELPQSVSMHINQGENLNDATNLSGLTTSTEIGKTQGIIGLLTNGRLPRKAYMQQALMNAFIHLEHHERYKV
jgi:inosine/xanthosine triphosphatase